MVGGGLAIVMTIILLAKAIMCKNVWYIITAVIYGGTMIAMFTCSAVYHALHEHNGKKAMRLVDHTMVFVFISGSITPFALCAIRPEYPFWGWMLFGVAWTCAIASIAMIYISFQKTRPIQMTLCMIESWMVIFLIRRIFSILGPIGFGLLLGGGIIYTIGSILFGVGAKKKYMHSIFHFLILVACIMHFFAVLLYVYV